MYSDVLQEIQSLIDDYPGYRHLVGGDFNVDFDTKDSALALVKDFIRRNKLERGDELFPVSSKFTYVSESLSVSSRLDYLLISCVEMAIAFNVIDLDVNLSDHLPIMIVCLTQSYNANVKNSIHNHCSYTDQVKYFRWDRAPLHIYYEQTRLLLEPLLADLSTFEADLSQLDKCVATLRV